MSSWRSAGRPPKTSTKRSARAPSAWPRKPAPASTPPSCAAWRAGPGLGRAVAEWLAGERPPHADVSVLCAATRLGIPVTAHVAIGTDIVHMHPDASGAAIGEGSLRDFRHLAASVARLRGRRLPELRVGGGAAGGVLEGGRGGAQSRARPRRASPPSISTSASTTGPLTNVVRRPTAGIGRGIHLTGHHEIMIPLLAAALVERSTGGQPP